MIKSLLKKALKAAFRPRILRQKVIAGTMSGPRKRETALEEGPAKVFSIEAGAGLMGAKKAFESSLIQLLPGVSGSRILIKINLNTADPYPASTSPEFLAFFVSFLREAGASKIMVGDCSSLRCLPTKLVLAKTRLGQAIEGAARFVFFDEEAWVKVPVNGYFLKEVTVPRVAVEADLIMFLANIKSHGEADFSFGLKLAVGLMHPVERYLLHRNHLAEKIAEANLAVEPDLTIIDGRKAMITGGPDRGDIVEEGKILFGRNPLAVDLEAYRTLYRLKSSRGVTDIFEEDPLIHPQLRHAMRIGIGGLPFKGYEVIES